MFYHQLEASTSMLAAKDGDQAEDAI